MMRRRPNVAAVAHVKAGPMSRGIVQGLRLLQASELQVVCRDSCDVVLVDESDMPADV